MKALTWINTLIALGFVVFYSYHLFYIIVSLVKKPRSLPPAAPRRYGVVISARNEESVIGQLIRSIRRQDYPAELIDIFVVADNCTDRTAAVAREAGAHVWERINRQDVGKGYALSFLFERIRESYGDRDYAGYFVFDADNLLDEHYIAEMNRTFAAGYRVVTSYRNSKNYGANWISAGYSLWFLREARFLNNARMILGVSCSVSGTGFLVHRDIIERNGGWKHYLLTEDIEFSVDCILHGERIGYCDGAILYDEQPVSLRQSWDQRMRWAKGFLQVFRDYGGRLFRGVLSYGGFSCYDLSMIIFPVIVPSLISAIITGAVLLSGPLETGPDVLRALRTVGLAALNGYLALLLLGALTLATEWRRIHCSASRKLLLLFSLPIFQFTYVPISIVAIFKKVEWRPIIHTVSKSLDEVRSA